MLRLAIGDGCDSATLLRRGNTPAPRTVDRADPDSSHAGVAGRIMGAAPARVVVAPPGDGLPGRIAPHRAEGSVGRGYTGRDGARVAAENRLASAQPFDPLDPRWVLAVRTANAIEGGRAAVLPPESRARLLSLATRLGLRPFDANLVIAIVQDGARSGEGPLEDQAQRRLALIRRPRRAAGRGTIRGRKDGVTLALRLAAAGLIAAGMAAMAIGWIGQG